MDFSSEQITLVKNIAALIVSLLTIFGIIRMSIIHIFRPKRRVEELEHEVKKLELLKLTASSETSEKIQNTITQRTKELKLEITRLNTKLSSKIDKLNEAKNTISHYEDKLERLKGVKDPLDQVDLIQEEKIVYVKYLYITPNTHHPIYTKSLPHLDESVDVYSEHLYYRFNKFNKPQNSITITDSSAKGVVDLNIIFPWLGKAKHTSKTDVKKDMVQKTLRNSETYLTLTSYYNGFIEDEEDIGMRMENDTKSARLIVDFSSIPNYEKLFTKNPDGIIKQYANDPDPTIIEGLSPERPGIYILEHTNLKADSKMMLDFHVDWEYLDK